MNWGVRFQKVFQGLSISWALASGMHCVGRDRDLENDCTKRKCDNDKLYEVSDVGCRLHDRCRKRRGANFRN